MKTIHERALAYIGSIHSISGSNGSDSCLKAAIALIKGFGLPEDEALELLQIWNATNASPPWPIADLKHKIADAAKSPRPVGYLLASERTQIAPRTTHATRSQPTVTAELTTEEKRAQWPTFDLGTPHEHAELSSLRHVGLDVVEVALREGYLCFVTYHGYRCYAMQSGTMAQVRRLNGEPFEFAGRLIKSINLSGSVGKWLGHEFLERNPRAPVIIIEGLTGYLEALEATFRHAPEWLPLAALSASVPLEDREIALLQGRRVTIARDRGSAGAEAAVRWQNALQESGINCQIWTPPTPAKDLGDCLSNPDRANNLTTLFNQQQP